MDWEVWLLFNLAKEELVDGRPLPYIWCWLLDNVDLEEQGVSRQIIGD